MHAFLIVKPPLNLYKIINDKEREGSHLKTQMGLLQLLSLSLIILQNMLEGHSPDIILA